MELWVTLTCNTEKYKIDKNKVTQGSGDGYMEFQRAQILEMQCPLALHRNGMGKQPNLPMSQEVGKIGEQMNFKGYQGQGK